MTPEDVVRALMAAVNAEDFAGAMDLVADDVVLVLHGDAARLAGSGATGKEAFGRWFADWFRMFEPGYRFAVESIRADGDEVTTVLVHHARGRASGAEVTMPSTWVYTVRDGLIVRAVGSSG